MGSAVCGSDLHCYRTPRAERDAQGRSGLALGHEGAGVVKAMSEFGRGDGVHAAIDTSGFTPARTAALEGLRPHGIYVKIGVGGETVYKLSEPLLFRELTIIGSWIFKLYEWEDLLDFVRRHQLPVKEMIARCCRIDDAVAAFKLADSAMTGKIVFDWTSGRRERRACHGGRGRRRCHRRCSR